jgi:membrane associated rhomboid family serine protease
MNNAYIYQFAHASWMHLFINALSLYLMFNPIKKVYEERFGHTGSFSFFSYAYLGSVLAALLTPQTIPTVGASGIVFFLLGELIMLRPTLRQLQGYIYVAIAIIIQIIRGKSNVALHIVAFILGVLFIITRLLCKQYKERLDSINDRDTERK